MPDAPCLDHVDLGTGQTLRNGKGFHWSGPERSFETVSRAERLTAVEAGT